LNGPQKNLSALKGMPLKKLSVSGGGYKPLDISALKGLPLEDLTIVSFKLSNLSCLRGMPLKRLSLQSHVQDISPIEGMDIMHLNIPPPKNFMGNWQTTIRSLKSLKTIGVYFKSYTPKQFFEKYGEADEKP
jgi:hypothetical protein